MSTKTFLKSKKGELKIVLPVLVILSLFFLLAFVSITPDSIAATSEEESTVSNATVNYFVAITMSTNMTEGIRFSTIEANSADNNATDNFNSSDHTMYWIQNDWNSNTDIDVCIKDDAALTSGVNTIPNIGYTYMSNATNNLTNPGYEENTTSAGIAITTAYVTSPFTNITNGTNSYFRFFTDIPDSQPAGYYENNVYFKGIQAGQSC